MGGVTDCPQGDTCGRGASGYFKAPLAPREPRERVPERVRGPLRAPRCACAARLRPALEGGGSRRPERRCPSPLRGSSADPGGPATPPRAACAAAHAPSGRSHRAPPSIPSIAVSGPPSRTAGVKMHPSCLLAVVHLAGRPPQGVVHRLTSRLLVQVQLPGYVPLIQSALPEGLDPMAVDVGAAAALDPQVHVAVAVDVARRRRLQMEVGGAGGRRDGRIPLVLPFDRIGQRGRRPEHAVVMAQEQLRRIAVPRAVRVHVCTGVEDREVVPAVAVEVVGDHDRVARLDRPLDQLRGGSEAPVPGADEHVQWRLREAVLGRRSDGVLDASSNDEIVPAIAVQICDREDEVEPARGRGRW